MIVPSRFRHAGIFLAIPALAAAALAQTAPAPAPAADTSGDQDIIQLSPFTVTTEQDTGYKATNSIGATRTNTPVRDVPLSINIFTPDLYNDLVINNSVDLEAYDATLINGGADPRSDQVIQQQYNQFLFRGFRQNWFLRDGIREYDPRDTQGLDSVEVIDGPVAPLYGLTYPGGIIQMNSKVVDFSKNFTDIRLTTGSYGEYRASLDSNITGVYGSGAQKGKLGVRVNLADGQTEDERAHSVGHTQFENAVMTWEPFPSTEIQGMYEHELNQQPNGLNWFTTGETNVAGEPWGTPLNNGSEIPLQIFHPNIPWTWNWSNGEDFRSLDTTLLRASITQKIGDNLVLKGYVQNSKRDQIDGDGYDAANNTAVNSGTADGWESGGGWIIDPVTHQETIQSAWHYRDWGNIMNAYGATGIYKLNFGDVKNTFSFGANSWTENFVSHSQADVSGPGGTPVYIIMPVEAGINTTVPSYPPPDITYDSSNNQSPQVNKNSTYFLNWQLALFDNKLKVNAGVNDTQVHLVQWTSTAKNVIGYDISESKTSPLIGAVYDITKEVSLFVVHSTSLFPDTNRNSITQQQFSPIVGSSAEGGVKVEALNGRISGSISVYRIDQSGGSQLDPALKNIQGTLGDYVQGGSSESTGWDANLLFQPTHNWQVAVTVAHNNEQVTSAITQVGQPTTVGQENPEEIRLQYSILTKYSFTDSALKGFSIGAGLHGGTQRLDDYYLWNGVWVPRYTPGEFNLEAFAEYRMKVFGYDTTLQLNARNLTKQAEYYGWQATGSASVLATTPYSIPTEIHYYLTLATHF
jgi:outer membrane receptor for ferric coprogen and ferric-rhodotorulic acid